jgi:hypothetical protein
MTRSASILVTVLSVVLLLASAAHATNYYVANAGNDSGNDCTNSASPCQTLTKIDTLTWSAGTNIYLNRGDTFREQLTILNGGSSGSPVTIDAYGTGADPIISGAIVLTGWTLYSGSIYRISETAQVHNVYVDNPTSWGLNEACAITGGTQSGECSQANMNAGSFFMDTVNNFLYVWLSDSSNPSDHTVEGSTLEFGTLANYGGTPVCKFCWTTIQNIHFRYQWAFATYFHDYATAGTSCQDGQGLDGIVINNNIIDHQGTGGSVDNNIYANSIHILDESECDDPDTIVENNTVSYCGQHNCIEVQGGDRMQVIGNDCSFNNNHNCIDGKVGVGYVFKNNYVHDTGTGLFYDSELAAHWAGPNGSAGSVTMANNTMHNVSNGAMQCAGADPSPAVVHCYMYNNTAYMDSPGGSTAVTGDSTQPGGTTTTDMRDNIFYNYAHGTYFPFVARWTLTSDYNNWYPTPSGGFQFGSSAVDLSSWQSGGYDLNSIFATPNFQTLAPSFTLAPGSPDLNAAQLLGYGVNIGANQSSPGGNPLPGPAGQPFDRSLLDPVLRDPRNP